MRRKHTAYAIMLQNGGLYIDTDGLPELYANKYAAHHDLTHFSPLEEGRPVRVRIEVSESVNVEAWSKGRLAAINDLEQECEYGFPYPPKTKNPYNRDGVFPSTRLKWKEWQAGYKQGKLDYQLGDV